MKKSFGAAVLIHPAPVWVVGTYDKDGKPNAMTVAWCGICSSKPPSVTVSLWSGTSSYGNIVQRKCFTISVPSEKYVKEVDYFGIASRKPVDKFAATGLTPAKSEYVDAPYVEEFPLVLECKVIQVTEIGVHTQFVGEIVDVKADEAVLGEKGLPEIEKVQPILFAPESRAYYGTGKYLGKAFEIGKQL